jgi:prophage antirepressor-like protein
MTGNAEPLKRLLLGSDRWIADRELAVALDPHLATKRKSLVVQFPRVVDLLGSEDLSFRKGGLESPAERHGGKGNCRLYSKKALVLLAMHARTPNAEAFRSWLAEEAVAALHRPG